MSYLLYIAIENINLYVCMGLSFENSSYLLHSSAFNYETAEKYREAKLMLRAHRIRVLKRRLLTRKGIVRLATGHV